MISPPSAGTSGRLGDGRTISCGAIGIHRWKILARGPAGHWLGGGLPNTNQGIARAVDRILALRHAGRQAEDCTLAELDALWDAAKAQGL